MSNSVDAIVAHIARDLTDPLKRRIADLESALREIEHEVDVSNPGGGDELLAFVAGTARDALRKLTPT